MLNVAILCRASLFALAVAMLAARGSNWTVDYPKGDRTFAAILRRLTRLDIRSVEQPVNPDDGDDIYYWPYLHVGMPGSWQLTDAQAAKLRDYLLRGGFLLCDSFFGTEEWSGFEAGMRRIFPNRRQTGQSANPLGSPVRRRLGRQRVHPQVRRHRSLSMAAPGAPHLCTIPACRSPSPSRNFSLYPLKESSIRKEEPNHETPPGLTARPGSI